MALENSLQRQPAASGRPMLTNGLDRIVGTAWPETAAGPQQWAKSILIEPDQADEKRARDTS
ncbi:hypothetical protein GCM10007159_04910 [Modicisalibacter luteus]|nr:hypothetical protein GCM10007159_04910 [Halomonas lutea]